MRLAFFWLKRMQISPGLSFRTWIDLGTAPFAALFASAAGNFSTHGEEQVLVRAATVAVITDGL